MQPFLAKLKKSNIGSPYLANSSYRYRLQEFLTKGGDNDMRSRDMFECLMFESQDADAFLRSSELPGH